MRVAWSIVAWMLAAVGCYGVVQLGCQLDKERRDHAAIGLDRAMEIMRNVMDANLRNAARAKLQDGFLEALSKIRAEAEAGDLQAQAVLARWRAAIGG